jgi:metallo-beta-lactamase family protein
MILIEEGESLISQRQLQYSMKLEFHGASGGVTGSHTVLDMGGFRIGIDAGLFQGDEADQNRLGFGHDPRSLEALLPTHAHLDHSGRIPILLKEGFQGLVYSTAATADICKVMLQDSAHLMEEAADRENRQGIQPSGNQNLPLYTEEDVERAMQRFRTFVYNEKHDIRGISVKFRDAGHILGSSMVELSFGEKRLILSGDLGRPGSPFLRDPEKVDEADWLVLESTYGDRDHGNISDRGKKLLEIVLETIDRGGNVVIPAFAIGRTQEILYELNPYAETGKLKGVKCFVDSPMAVSAVEIYRQHPECFDEETIALLKKGDNPLEFPGVIYARSKEESKAINDFRESHIIISASGMCTGGRVLHHLVHNLERNDCTILFVGYQGAGTLGRRLLEGAKTVSVMGKQMDVKARIESLDGFSAHAGKSETMNWLHAFKRLPSQIFLNHGEPPATEALAETIRNEFGTKVITPKINESYQLG